MKNKIKTKTEIIKETKEYYSEDPSRRAVSDGCKYYDDNKMCAIGRCLIDAKKAEIDTQNCSGFVKTMYEKGFINIDKFKEEYRIEDFDFWEKLQSFHDYKEFWNYGGLTFYGQKYYNNLLAEYDNN